jgi:hypothetical protein
MSMAVNQQASFFDMPAKTPEQMKSIVNDIPALRALKHKKQTGTSARPSIPKTAEEKEQDRKDKSIRTAERRARAKELIAQHQPEPGVLERMDESAVRRLRTNAVESDPNLEQENNSWLRDLSSSSATSSPYWKADTGEYYDKFAQGYRMLGGFIDCDHAEDGSGDHSGDNNNGNNNNNGNSCSRWMMWAAYINPNYNGNGRDEYFNYDEDGSAYAKLDCHSPSTEWLLMGVYREEFYQYLEQISKHLWAIDDYEYVVALAGLAYIQDSDCFEVGYYGGASLYAGVMPQSGGDFIMGLYTDSACLYADTSSGMTYDDYFQDEGMNLGSKDDGCISDDTLSTLYGYWTASQEYTLALVNEVYSEYKYCTLCMDYPTYQDGYFIGDSGTDDDDMINQCWKFHSHDSYACETDCLSLGSAQGTIVQIYYNGHSYGTSWDGSGSGSDTTFDHYAKGYSTGSSGASNLQRFKANAYLTFNGVLFIATFLAFSVARGSRLDSSEKSRSLLSRKKSTSARSRTTRSKSGARSSSKSGARSSSKSGGASASRSKSGTRTKSASSRSSSRKKSTKS